MEQMICRLLTDAKEEKRTAGLDILLQLKMMSKDRICLQYVQAVWMKWSRRGSKFPRRNRS